jgi:SAM-dependent methyltransferase
MQRWYHLSKNPNLPVVKAAREQKLVAARQEALVVDRIQYLTELARNKDVLDVGVVAHDANIAGDDKWLHKHLAKAARTCLGVDILEAEVEKLRAHGFNVICTDIVAHQLEQKFDLVVCGEVLEHVDAPGLLLSSCAKMLRPSGRLVVTVPNPWFAGYLRRSLLNGPPLEDNVDHVAWFDPCTLCELGERQGLVLDSFSGIRHGDHNQEYRALKQMLFGLTPVLVGLGLRPELFAKTMIYEFVLDQPSA